MIAGTIVAEAEGRRWSRSVPARSPRISSIAASAALDLAHDRATVIREDVAGGRQPHPRPERSMSGTASLVSTRLMRWLTAGWLRPSAAAVAVSDPVTQRVCRIRSSVESIEPADRLVVSHSHTPP